MSAPLSEPEAEQSVRETFAGWVRLASGPVAALLVPVWVFTSVIVYDPVVAGPLLALFVGAAVAAMLVPVALLILTLTAGVQHLIGRWERARRRALDARIDADAVLVGVEIRSRTEGAPEPQIAAASGPVVRRAPAAPAAPAVPSRPLASLGARCAAAVLDGLLPSLALAVPVGLVEAFGGEAELVPPLLLYPSSVGALFALAGIWGVQLWWLSTRGQTIGKRALGIRIVDVDGGAPSFVSVVLVRWIAWSAVLAIPFFGFLALLADVFVLASDSRRQSLHDRIAGTLVVPADAGLQSEPDPTP